jgi:periplasmic protein TonB
MKTNYNSQNNSNVISLDDIIFDGRNHAYGAYALRKNHHKYTNISFLFASSLAIALVAATLINRHPEPAKVPDRVWTNPDPFSGTIDPPVVPPAPPAHVSQSLIKQIIYTVPVVVDIPDPDPTKEIMTNEQLIALIGSTGGSGTGIEGGTGTGIFPTPIPIDSTDKPRWTVQEPARFEGNFGEWIGKHLKYPHDAEEMRVGGKVTVQFIINKQGKVENPIVTRGAHPDLDKEAIRVIVSSSSLWTPGKQDGYPVKQFFNMTITFQTPKN